jgi:hypothetical protein
LTEETVNIVGYPRVVLDQWRNDVEDNGLYEDEGMPEKSRYDRQKLKISAATVSEGMQGGPIHMGETNRCVGVFTINSDQHVIGSVFTEKVVEWINDL